MLKLQEICRLHIELTTRCNARCPMCMRNYRGYDYNSGYPLTELSLENFKQIVTPHLLTQINTPVAGHVGWFGVSFNGNLGDFGLARDALEIVKYVVEHEVPVKINTNGSMRTTSWWAELALPGVEIGFDLDGLADTHHLYRQDTDWHKIIANAQAFIQAGGRAIWRFIPFNHNQHQEQQCRKLAQELGFAGFENIYDGRDRGPVFTRQGEFSHHIGAPWDNTIPQLKDHLTSHITWYNKNNKFEKDTKTLNLRCIHKVNREIYIAADGSVYPCCFLGFYPQSMHHPGNQELQEIVKENNALEHSLEHCLEWFEKVEQSWQKPSISQGRIHNCVQMCNRV